MKLLQLVPGAVVTITLACSPTMFMAQGPPPPNYQEGRRAEPWEMAPPEFQEVQRRGFHDGVEGARKDFDNHRPPNVNNRDEYRHPDVSRSLRHDYREAFRHGYQVGVKHIYGGPRPY